MGIYTVDKAPQGPIKCCAKIDGLAYSWCPTMDLVAFSANNGKLVVVYRKNGSKVWELAVEDGMVKSLVWRPDGKQFAVITTMNKCRVYESNTARQLTRNDKIKDDITFGEWILSNETEDRHKFSNLVNLDYMLALPKLPPLPNTSEWNTFTTKVAIDGLIQQNDKGKEMDLLLLFSETKLHITFNALFPVESIDLIGPSNDDDEEIVAHIPKDLENHYVITSSFTTMKLQLRHFKIDIDKDHRLVQDLTSLSSKIIALLGYIDEILIFLAQNIKTLLDFSDRYINLLKEESKSGSFRGDLYDLLLTGMHNTPELYDWIENSLGERGMTRWSKTGEAVYENTRRTIFYHLIPSCERLMLLLSQIKGTSRAYIPQEKNFNFDLLEECTKSVNNFMKISFNFIMEVMKEQELFGAFINWLQAEFREIQGDEPRTVFKTSDVTSYLDSHLESSRLKLLTPQFRRHFNEVRINTTDLFASITSLIKDFVHSDEEKFELGMVTEKQKLRFDCDTLYIYSHGNAIITIYRFNTITKKLDTVDVEMGNEVLDIQISKDQDETFIVIGGEVISFQSQHLFDQNKTHFKFDDLKIMKSLSFDEFKPKYITINTTNNVGCVVSQDLEKFSIFDLKTEEERVDQQSAKQQILQNQPDQDSSGDLIL